MFRGSLWTVGASVAARLVGAVGTFALTWFLEPKVAGEVGVAVVLVMTANQISTLGFGQYLAARPQSGSDVAFHATVWHIGLGLLALGVVTLFRDPLAVPFGAEGISRYVPGMALALFIARVGFVPNSLLLRDLRFRPVALTRSLSELLYAVASVALAAAGWGGMSIVIANILQSSFRTLLFILLADRRAWLTPSRLSLEKSRDLFGFSLPLWLAGTAHFASVKWDNLVVAGLSGPARAAVYNYAYNLGEMPATAMSDLPDVLTPSYSRMAPGERSVALVRSLALVGIPAFPLAIGLGAVAPSLIHALFRPQWHGIAPLLTVLCLLSALRPLFAVTDSFLQAQGHPRLTLALSLMNTTLILSSIGVSGRVGLAWACAGVIASLVATFLVTLRLIQRKCGVPLRLTLTAAARPLLPCIPMAAVAVGARLGLAALGFGQPGLALVASVTGGAVAYVAGAFLLIPDLAQEGIAVFKNALARRRGRSAASA
jgi:PST family polysaccharide transporter